MPTAAAVTVSGRVATSGGYAISRARVTLRDGEGNVLTVITSPFGYYSIEGVRAGHTYIASVSAKGYTFQPRTLNVVDSLADVDFRATEGWH